MRKFKAGEKDWASATETISVPDDLAALDGIQFASLDDGPTAAIPGLGTVTRQRVNDHLEAMFRSSRTFNLWHRTVGTQFHKARIDAHFRPVFDETQKFLFDTSQFTMDATDKAPSLLPRFECVGDVLRDAKGRAAQEKDLDGRSKFPVTSSGVAGCGSIPDRVFW